jgi:hypothetical protein
MADVPLDLPSRSTAPSIVTSPFTSQITGGLEGWFLKVTVTPLGISTEENLKTTAHFSGS